MNRIFYKTIELDTTIELFRVFGDFYASGTTDAEVTKSLNDAEFLFINSKSQS